MPSPYPAPDWSQRPATPADVEPVAELKAVVMRPDLERLGRYDTHRVRQRLRDEFRPAYTTVIEVAGAFAGCVALAPYKAGPGGPGRPRGPRCHQLAPAGCRVVTLIRLKRLVTPTHSTIDASCFSS